MDLRRPIDEQLRERLHAAEIQGFGVIQTQPGWLEGTAGWFLVVVWPLLQIVARRIGAWKPGWPSPMCWCAHDGRLYFFEVDRGSYGVALGREVTHCPLRDVWLAKLSTAREAELRVPGRRKLTFAPTDDLASNRDLIRLVRSAKGERDESKGAGPSGTT